MRKRKAKKLELEGDEGATDVHITPALGPVVHFTTASRSCFLSARMSSLCKLAHKSTMNIQLNAMTTKDYSFEPVGTVDPASAPPVVEAVPATPGNLHTEEEEDPSDTAIMVGCGLMGWFVG